MRKFIAVTLTSLSAGAMVLGVAPAANAAPVIPVVCDLLPNILVGSSAALVAAGNTLGVKNANLSTARADLDSAVDAWTTAIDNHLTALDAGDPTAATQIAMDAALSIVGSRVADWSTARGEQVVAQGEFDVASIGQALNGQLASKLCGS